MANLPQLNATQWASLIASNPQIAVTIWSKLVIKGVTQRSLFNGLIGGEGSKMPIIKKNDLSKGAGDKVVFTTIAPVRGQGVLGETLLSGTESKVDPGTFELQVDLLRHATAYTQVNNLLRNWGGGGLMDLTAQMETEWWARKQDDDIQIRLRNHALLVAPDTNVVRIGNRVSRATLRSSDTLSTSTIEQSKGALSSIGAMPIETAGGTGMQDENEKYLLLAPDNFMLPLKSTASFINALENGDIRGDANKRFSGKFPVWDGNILCRHVVKEDAANGRQGSPLEPFARLGTALANATPTTITGGGLKNPAGDSDYFAYFPGFGWKIFDAEVLPTDTSTHYAMIYNLTGADAGKYEIFSYTAAGVSASGHQITGVTRGTTTNFNGNVIANAAGRFTAVHPSGSLIIPCTINGVLLGWGLHTGASALYHATGKIEAEPIGNGQDYKNSAGEWHLVGQGMQGIRGMSPYRDTRGIATNFVLIEGARWHPYVRPEPFLG